jgi:hypothetical protein
MRTVVTLRNVALIAALGMFGCGIFPEKVATDDPRVQSLLKAASACDRSRYGFSPLPTTGYVHLESRPTAGYDAMLHIDERTSRTMAFRKNPNGFTWIAEQEIFQGPKTYTTVDGTFKEQICLTYETQHVSGVALNRLDVAYSGDDRRLHGRDNLLLGDVKPILKEWGY